MKAAASRLLARPAYLSLALIIVVGVCTPLLVAKAYALGQITTRSVQLSSSTAGAAATYTVTFTPATTGTVQAVVLNLCDDTPLISTSCQWSTGQSASLGTLAVTAVSGMSDTTLAHWTASAGTQNASAGNGIVVVFKDATANTFTAATPVSFTLTGITNPNYTSNAICATANQPNCSFYGRLITYSSTATTVAADYFSNNITDTGAITPVDAGGIAMSTAAQITVTAKVQELLAFCVWSNLGTGQACGAASTSPAITLGNSNGVLSSSNAYANNDTSYSVQTNASSGAAIMVKGTTLTNGTYSIAAMTTQAVSARGTAQFGLCTYQSSGSTLTFTGGTMSGNYNGGVTAGHLCSNTADGAGTTSGTSGTGVGDAGASFYYGTNALPGGAVNGDQIAADAAGTTAQGQIAFMANIPVTQAPGIYTANVALIANGTY